MLLSALRIEPALVCALLVRSAVIQHYDRTIKSLGELNDESFMTVMLPLFN